MAGKFELYAGKSDTRFRLKAGNGEKILASQGYKTKDGAKGGIESVRKNSQDDSMFERLTAKDGSPYFNLKAGNGEIIGTSEMYSSASSMENGIASVKKNAPDAEVVDKT